jgi:subtilisin family serine protease
MNLKTRTCMTTLGCAMLAMAAGTVSGADAQSTQPSAQRITQSAGIATKALSLQPGDRALMEKALSNPMVFTEIRNERALTGELIVHAAAGKSRTALARVSPIMVKSSKLVEEYVIRVPGGMNEGELASMLMATGDYEFVEPNWTLYPAIIPNDPQFGSSWQHTRLQSAAAWDLNTGSSDVIVAVCDTGVDLDHPDLMASLVPGYNSPTTTAQVDGGQVGDILGHGTFVSGCAAARGNNGTGVVGVGWDFKIMPVRITNNSNGTASLFDINEGARWAGENGASIVNVSFSGGTSGSNQTTGAYLKTLGSLLFWAAGNDGSFISPNRPDYVIVGSTTSSDNRSGFSNFGPAVDVTAPGSGVRSTQNGGGYGNSSGTSFASPIAAGVGAMIYSVNPDFSGDDVQAILYASVDDLGAPGRDDSFGRGRVNTRNAIEFAQSYVRPILTPLSESFETDTWQTIFVATEGTPGSIAVPDAPDGSSVLLLDGTDTIETVTLAGRSVSNVALSFMLKASDIEPGESLDVQYLENPETAPNTWTTLVSHNGQGPADGAFIPVVIELPNGYKWHGVKLRFVANGSDASDIWMIDSFSINTLGGSVAPLEDGFESGVVSGLRWEENEGATVVVGDDNYAVELADTDLIESRDLPLFQFGFVPAFVRFDASVDNSVTPGDTLNVEVFNIGNEWESIAMLDASDLGTSAQLIQFETPFTAWALDDMKVRLTASTTGAFIIDNVYVGVDELVGGCNAADLAEPFGELNFFDVSAFLSAFSANDPAGDLNNDGAFNFFDVSEFLTVFNGGCP